MGGSPLATPEIVKLPMPSALNDPNPRTYIFQYKSSCPALLSKLDCKATSELVCVQIISINNSFSTMVDPEVSGFGLFSETKISITMRNLKIEKSALSTLILEFGPQSIDVIRSSRFQH